MRLAGETSLESRGVSVLAGALLLGGPVWQYLYAQHYPFNRPEALVLSLGAMLLGAVAASLARAIGGAVEALVFGAMLFVFVDLQFDLHLWVPTAALVVACVGLPFLVRQRRAALTSITLSAFYAASLVRAGPDSWSREVPTQPIRSELPIVVHVILDGQWGVGGLRAAGDVETADFLTAFYRARGFELHEAAYSRFYRTRESVSSTLALGTVPGFTTPDPAPDEFRLREIPYFERLRARGYTIEVQQSSYMDYCRAASAPVDACETQPANSIATIGHLRGDWVSRALYAGRYLLNVRSHVYARLAGDPDTWRRANAGGGIVALSRAREAIARRATGGAVFFIHVLLPHRPVVVDSQCRALRERPWWREDAPFQPMGDSAWRSLLAFEAGQTRCAHLLIGTLIESVDAAVGRDRSIILVHGDHGARRYRDPPASLAPAALDRAALNAQFSTLLAVRRPGVPPALHSEPVPVQDFVEALVRQDFSGPVLGRWRHFVFGQPADTVPRALTPADMSWARTTAASDTSRRPGAAAP